MSYTFSLVRARRNIRPYVGDVDAAAVACGFGRAIGNKVPISLNSTIVHA